jgi:hypothetical protein
MFKKYDKRMHAQIGMQKTLGDNGRWQCCVTAVAFAQNSLHNFTPAGLSCWQWGRSMAAPQLAETLLGYS